MKTYLNFLVLTALIISASSFAAVVWEENMSSLAGWTQRSNATNEAGETTGGIRVAGGTYVQMNSWWDSAGWTQMYKNTGVIIQPATKYTLTLSMVSFASSAAVPIQIQNASTSPWSVIVSASPAPATGAVANYTISFSSITYASNIGGSIAIAVNPGWWNNVGIDNMKIEAEQELTTYNPTPAVNATSVGTLNGNKADVTFSWSTGPDINNLALPNPAITKHYFYLRAADPNFVGMTPVEIPAGTPTQATGSYGPVSLDLDKTYYWRVDESVNNSIPTDPNTILGGAWKFETLKSIPVITVQPAHAWTNPNGPASFTITVTSVSQLSYQWYKSEDNVADPLTDTKVGTNSATFSITNAQVADDAFYFCVATNLGGTSTSNAAKLTVKRLIAHWTFDNTLTDASGNGWDGFYSPPAAAAYETGLIGGALSLGSDPNFVTILGTEDAFNFYCFGMTVSAWIKSSHLAWATVASKENRTGTYVGWELMLNWQGYPSFTMHGGGSSSGTPAINVCDGQWHLLTGIFDPDTRIPHIYIDGELKSSGTAGSATILPSPVPAKIGALLDDGNTPYSGLVDDVWMYNYPLNKYAVAQLFYDATGKNVCIESYASTVDLNHDCKIDMSEFVMIAAEWLKCGLYPYCQ